MKFCDQFEKNEQISKGKYLILCVCCQWLLECICLSLLYSSDVNKVHSRKSVSPGEQQYSNPLIVVIRFFFSKQNIYSSQSKRIVSFESITIRTHFVITFIFQIQSGTSVLKSFVFFFLFLSLLYFSFGIRKTRQCPMA